MVERVSVLTPRDTAARWRPGERLHGLIEERVRSLAAAGADHVALAFEAQTVSYAELAERVHRLARYLRRQGVGPGDRVGHLFAKGPESYVALLAILEAGAAFVPLDEAIPPARLRFIAEDASLRAVVSRRPWAERLREASLDAFLVDDLAAAIRAEEAAPLAALGGEPDALAYVVYTSGTTGRPKGVAVRHSSICSFVRVAAEAYGYREDDRVYQGMTLAFDFSFEELLVPLAAGATVVPAPEGLLLGRELHEVLRDRGVTVLCCVPTLLASIPEELPALRLILVGGEATPPDLVARWARPERTLLNTYGPTETTVTATAGRLVAERPVTIGAPLPTYSIAILDPEAPALVPFGGVGEIGIAGVGLAEGYLNLEAETRAKFIPDFLGLPDNPSARIYRTGDLGRVTDEGEVEFLGRVDTQVKLRGYRVELTEIESVLMEHEAVAQAVVEVAEISPGERELVAYYTRALAAGPVDGGDLLRRLAERLPRYMLPAYAEELEALPTLPSHKVDRKALPPPTGRRLTAAAGPAKAAANAVEARLVAAMRETLGVGEVSTEADFFEELGASSLVLARFAARLREDDPRTAPTIRECYLHPRIDRLAARLAEREGADATPAETTATRSPSRWAYAATGAFQLSCLTVASFIAFTILVEGARWLLDAYRTDAFYLRATALGVGLAVVSMGTSVAAKWLLIGRFEAGSFPLWSWRYCRFWLVRQLVGLHPLAAFKGTPLYNLYLRMLGAKVSLSAVIEAATVPVCADLLTVGRDAVLRKGVVLTGYRVDNHMVHVGPVAVGDGAYVGEGSVIDVDTTIGAGAQLGHASALHQGRTLEPGRRYHGSPAVETTVAYARLPTEGRVVGRGVAYGLAFLVPGLFALPALLYVTLELLPGADGLAIAVAYLQRLLAAPAATVPSYLALTTGLYTLGIAVALAGTLAWPRLCMQLLTPGRTYRLFGLRYLAARVLVNTSNSRFFHALFGDSSAITTYLRSLGYDLHRLIQTGSNFGTSQEHDVPFLCTIGTGTMASDGLSMVNVHRSATSFRLVPTEVPERCFLGNDLWVPAESRLGRNCLVGTKTLIPIEGPIREDTGLLGSPPFEIPRMVERDAAVLGALTPAARGAALRRKNGSNLATALAFLFSQWLYLSVAIVLTVAALFAFVDGAFGRWLITLVVGLAYTVAHFVLSERLSLGYRRLEEGMYSIYDPRFWRVERYWKLSDTPLPSLLTGTPFRGLLWRLLGVRVGRMLFDDGAIVTERTLVTLGDGCNLNRGACLQSHSLEDGVFKCAPIHVGAGCNLGAGCLVHYGVELGDRVTVEPDSFVMKGERAAPRSVWCGNPAQRVLEAAIPVTEAPPSAPAVVREARGRRDDALSPDIAGRGDARAAS